jgi:hypothetical protein
VNSAFSRFRQLPDCVQKSRYMPRPPTLRDLVVIMLLGLGGALWPVGPSASSASSASAQTLRFEDATQSAGMTLTSRGHGVAVRDYDKDGWPDLFVVSSNGPGALFRNQRDGTFQEAIGTGIDVNGRYAAPAWADINNDGWADLIVVGQNAPNKIYLAQGDGTFEDVSADSGIDLDARSALAVFGDYDTDGLVDLFIAVDDAADQLYHNLGGGRFEDVSVAAGITGPDHAVPMQAMWFDYDHNGTQDLFAVHDGFEDSRLHRNMGYLPLIDQARATGFDDVGAGNSMGQAWADVDGDGWEDVYVSRLGEAGLYMNQQGNGFLQIEDALGAWRNGMAWGTVFADFDNDLDPDIFVVNTSGYDGTKTLLYENRDSWFYDRSQSAGVSLRTETQGLATFDYDLDGLVDLVFPDHDGRVRVLRGTSEMPGNWLRIQLEGLTANRDAIGARVELRAGGQVLTRFVSGGDSYCSQSEPVMHFGLGAASSVDAVVVHWGGDNTEAFGSLTAGSYTLRQGSGTAVGVAAQPVPEIPASETLVEAFPNPFSADTSIRVHLPLAQQARISVFDVRGREVAILAQGSMPAGWNAINLQAEDLVTGIYFIRLETQSGIRTIAVARTR